MDFVIGRKEDWIRLARATFVEATCNPYSEIKVIRSYQPKALKQKYHIGPT
jgi:hypothetical protein